MILPWHTSESVKLESKRPAEEVMSALRASSDFERYTSDCSSIAGDSSSNQVARGEKPFIGVWNTEKGTFMLWHRHGSPGQAIMGRVAMGRIEPSTNGYGSVVTYHFTLRPWDRFFLSIGLLLLGVVNALVIFGCIVRPPSDWLFWITVCPGLLALAWFSPRISEHLYRSHETEVARILSEIAQEKK